MTDVFAMAPTESDERTQFAQDNLLDPAALPPPAWKGLTGQLQRGLRPAASVGRTLTLAGAPLAMAVDQAGSVFDDASDVLMTMRSPGWRPSESTPRTSAQDWYFRNVVDDVGTDAVTYWTPGPASTGTAAETVGTVVEVLGSIPQMVGTPGLFLADSALSPAIDVLNAGGDVETAAKVGGIQLGANVIGMKLPASVGNSLTARLASGAGMNLAVGFPADAATQAVLQDANLDERAASYDPFNVQARTLDVLMGAAFGWRAHLDVPPVTPSQRTAILAANNADHFAREKLPGEPKSEVATAQHRTAMQTAIQQVLRDQRVNVALDAAGFDLRPELIEGERSYASAEAVGPDYDRILVALESGGDPNAKAPTSSATGLHQFTKATWLRTISKVRPDLVQTMSQAELLALRTNPNMSREVERELRAANAAALERAGVDVSTWNLYAAHHFGEGGGVKFGRAADDTPMAEILTPMQLDANPYLKGKTKAQAIANWAQRAGVEPPQVQGKARIYVAADPESTRPLEALRSREAVEAEPVTTPRTLSFLDLAADDPRLTSGAPVRLTDAERTALVPLREMTPPDAAPGLFDFAQERGRVKVGDTAISYRKEGDEVSLDLIATPPRARGKGEARKAMEAFVRDADAQGVPVKLIVAEQGKSVDPARLEQFYGEFGFKRAGETDDGSPRMRREPQPVERRSADRIPGPALEGKARPRPSVAAPEEARPGAEAATPDADRAARDGNTSDDLTASQLADEFPDMLVPDDDGNLRPVAEYLAAVREAQALDDQTISGIEAATTCFLGTFA